MNVLLYFATIAFCYSYIPNYNKLDLTNINLDHTITLSIKQNNIELLKNMLEERGNPNNSKYQNWLSFNEIGKLVENKNATKATTEWLIDNDIKDFNISAHGEYITAKSSVEKWNKLFKMSLYKWENKINKNIIFRADNYTIPDILKSNVNHIFNTVQLLPNIYHSKIAKKFINNLRQNVAFQGTTISFLNNLYKIPSNIGHPNISHAVFETSEQKFQQSDLLKFQSKYGLTKQSALVYGTDPLLSGCNSNNCGEGSLDIQYIMGIAQVSPSIFWYEDTGHSDPFYNFIIHAANMTNPPSTLSISWSANEYQIDPSYLDSFNIEIMKLTLMGTTVFVSSGDDGVAGYNCLCNQDSSSDPYWWEGQSWTGRGYFPQYPATNPYVVAVGATMGPEKNNPEISCQSQYSGVITSGGGFSIHYPQPNYQKNAVDNFFNQSKNNLPQAGYNPNGRGYPDLSFIGVAYVPYVGGTQYVYYGTSASAPVAAGLFSLINSARKYKGLPNVGYVHPTLYANQNKFTDIISGNNKCCASHSATSSPTCCSSGFTTTQGWDPVTGLGSITYENLLSMFPLIQTTKPTTEPTPIPTTEPTLIPTKPTPEPTLKPTLKPTSKPIIKKTYKPTRKPTKKPIIKKTNKPTTIPTNIITSIPTNSITNIPTNSITNIPTSIIPKKNIKSYKHKKYNKKINKKLIYNI